MAKRKRASKRRHQPAQRQAAARRTSVVEAPPRATQKPHKPHPPLARAKAAEPRTLAVPPAAVAALVGLIAFVVYVVTVDPSVPTGDSGELISAAYVLGVAHPPGYPLYTMLGHLATLLPFGSPALRMNLLSALLDAVAVGLVFMVVYKLIRRDEDAARGRQPWTPLVAAAVGALLLAFSTVFWSYSVVAEVFALNNLFAALLLYLALEWARRPDRTRVLWLFAFVFGLSLTNQQTILTLVPAFAVLAWKGWRTLRRKARRSVRIPRLRWIRDLGIACGLFVAGLLPYAYLPAAASRNPKVNWGNPDTFHRFATDVTRANYGTFRLTVGGKSGSIGQQLDLLSGNLAHGFVFVGIALAVLGLWWTWREARAEGLALALAFVVAGPVFAAYTKTYFPDELTKGIVARFYILPSIPLAMLAGAGAWQVLVWARRATRPVSRPGAVAVAAAVALVAVPVAAAATNFHTTDQSGNYVAYDYGHDLLSPLAPHALLLMRSDENLTSVDYAQLVDKFRPDVVALDVELLKLPSYVDQVRRQHPDIVVPWDHYDGGRRTHLADMIQANIDQRPVYYVGAMQEKNFAAGFDSLRSGLATRLLPQGGAPDQYALERQQASRFAEYHFPTRSYPKESWETVLSQSYGNVAFDIGYALQTAHEDPKLAETMLRTAIRLNPTDSSAYKNLGLLLNDNRGDPKEIIALWTRFLQLKPNDPDAAAIEKALAQLKNK